MGRPVVILADTHVAIWSLADPERLSAAARAAMAEAETDGQLAVSAATFFELGILRRKKRIAFNGGLGSFLGSIEARFTVIPISAAACVRLSELPQGFPGDPFDQMIAATAVAEGIPLVTADREIRSANVCETIW